MEDMMINRSPSYRQNKFDNGNESKISIYAKGTIYRLSNEDLTELERITKGYGEAQAKRKNTSKSMKNKN
jgi:hypothetical protein